MDPSSATPSVWAAEHSALGEPAEVRETHTGLVVLVGDRAFKTKKAIKTDFLDFSTPQRRQQVCEREVMLNSRLAADSYLGIASFSDPDRGTPDPVIVMRRYPDACRLATKIGNGDAVRDDLLAIARTLARFHSEAHRGGTVDAYATVDAVATRWQENIAGLLRVCGTVLDRARIKNAQRLATRFLTGRATLFAERIAAKRIVDGHGDLKAEDIFCLTEGPALLDCLEFDDHLRYLDVIDDVALLAMDLEFLGHNELGNFLLEEYSRLADDRPPVALVDFYTAYRALVRAKVDCIRVCQGHQDAAADAQRHLDLAVEHLRRGAVRLILVGGGPGTGKTTLAKALAQHVGAHVISTDDVRRELQQAGTLRGTAGDLDTGLYAPENVATVYGAVMRRAQMLLRRGVTVILDGTWRDPERRSHARQVAEQTAAELIEFACTTALVDAQTRISGRTGSTSDATPQIAAAITGEGGWQGAHPIDTARALEESVAEARRICCVAI